MHSCAAGPLLSGTVYVRMKVDIIEMPPARVAYLRQIGPYGATINTFWNEKFWPWAKANGLDGRACYGLSHDDPSITPPEKCRYDACIEVPNGFVPGGSCNVATMPGGRYAALSFKGTANEISDAWTMLFRDWLPESGLTPDERPCFEYYPADTEFNSESGAFECKLCAPVAAA